MLYCCEVKNGVDKRVARFAVPFSVTVSANGSAVFIVTSAIFIAQYIGFDLSTSDVIVITWVVSASVNNLCGMNKCVSEWKGISVFVGGWSV